MTEPRKSWAGPWRIPKEASEQLEKGGAGRTDHARSLV